MLEEFNINNYPNGHFKKNIVATITINEAIYENRSSMQNFFKRALFDVFNSYLIWQEV